MELAGEIFRRHFILSRRGVLFGNCSVALLYNIRRPTTSVSSHFFFIYSAFISRWCYRFVTAYKKIYNEKCLRSCIYQEDDDAVYYMQKNETWLMERKLKIRSFPSGIYFFVFPLAAFFMTPFTTVIKDIIGLPFPHIFLGVFSLPITMMCLGYATRGWLGYYYYPNKIERETGKRVYVDMTPQGLLDLDK